MLSLISWSCPNFFQWIFWPEIAAEVLGQTQEEKHLQQKEEDRIGVDIVIIKHKTCTKITEMGYKNIFLQWLASSKDKNRFIACCIQ